MKSRIRWKFLPGVRPHPCDVAAAIEQPRAISCRRRNRGQALLLAVLIMLLAALLSAGVLAIVSGNLNQSARIADKTRAIEAARAGIAYANAQLSGSARGDLWRPVDVSPAPAPDAAGYDFYYSQLDRVQGWANSLAVTDSRYRDAAYGKFPAPGQANGDAPKFLLKVEEIAPNSATDSSHAGEIKITSIGLSDDDPNVFATSIAYKSGRRKSPWARALRCVSNWKFGDAAKNSGVPYATHPQIISATSFPANNVAFAVDATDKPLFSDDDAPFNVVIIKKDAAPNVRGAVVTRVENGGAKLTFARLEATIGATETIQKAAALGNGGAIDLLNTGTPAPYASDLPQPNGIVANGSVWLQGQIQLSNLSKSGTKLTTSGALAVDGVANSKPLLQNSGDIGANDAANPNSNQIVASSRNNFPGDLVLTGAAQSDGVKISDLVDDGWNTIGAQTLGLDYSVSRAIEPFAPARIDDAQNLARYRALARNSNDGLYIDNRDDIERVGANAMTQRQLLEMLISPATAATPPDTARLGVAALPGATDVSLEQRHVRGWVGPDEFLARGALVELMQTAGANPYLRVTLDARSDANPDGPDPNKTFRDDKGQLQTGVYSRNFAWPRNGTLMAEGNLRIRGNVNLSNLAAGTDAANFPSLTVVSLGNIYIEGALSVDSVDGAGNDVPILNRKKLMLLARKNVIVNPTRAVIGRTDAQTIATNTAALKFTGTATAKTLSVANALLFNTGDYVTIGIGRNQSVRGLITGVDAQNNQIKISSSDIFTVPPVTPVTLYTVKSPLETRDAGETSASDRLFFSTVNAQNAVNRRVLAALTQDTPTNRNRIIFDHSGELKGTATTRDGLNIKAADFDAMHPRPTDFTAVLANKQPLDANGNLNFAQTDVQKADKIARTYNNFTANNAKSFDNLASSAAKPLAQFAAEINATQESREKPAPEGYRYTAALTNSALATLPTHALAGVGLRYAPATIFVAPNASPANQRREDFDAKTRPAGFTIPLATSVEYDVNGALSNLILNSQARKTQYIGFDPKPGDSEDALTVDISFYQPKSEIFKSTLDSRILDLDAATNPQLTAFPQSLVLKRTFALSDAATSNLLPDYRMRALKLENASLNDQSIKPVTDALTINAFIYAQNGSWLVIPGDYFRTDPPVRGIADGTGKIVGSYVDFDNDAIADAGEYILRDPNDANSAKIADLNRDGKYDKGEIEAALRFVRYNAAPIQFLGAIVENQTAVVADVAAVAPGATPIVAGAVQNWTDKWATYNDAGADNADVGKAKLFGFLTYAYDPSLAKGSAGADELRVPITDDLIYQQ